MATSALIAQVHAQQVGDMGIVFNDQHAFGRHRQLGASGEAGSIVARLPIPHEKLNPA